MHFDLQAIKAAENLERYCDEHLTKRGPRQYNCPICGSGTGPNGSAAFNLYVQGGENRFKCFSCGNGGDLLDLIGAVEGIDDFEDRARRAAEFVGIEVETTVKTGGFEAKPEVRPYKPKSDHGQGREREAAKMSGWVAAYPGSKGEEYARERGIDGYPLTYGYDAGRQRLVIQWPGCEWYHIDRDITDRHPHKYEKPRSAEVGNQPLFSSGFGQKDTLVVVEGPLDAGAIMGLGFGHVAALCGTAHRNLVERLKEENFKGGVVVMLDHDEVGETSSAGLLKDLGEAGIAAHAFGWAHDDPKDADEAVRKGRGKSLAVRLTKAVEVAATKARDAQGSPNVRVLDPFEVAEQIFMADDADTPVSTGIAKLDEVIGLGLMPGLYVLGATSSFGKTTLTVQVADHVARQGRPVLFVTIEQSAKEIVAKSLSRITHDARNSVGGGLTAQEITTTTMRGKWDAARHAMLTNALNAYHAGMAPKLRIMEGVARPTVAEVQQAARDMRSEFGESPVIFIDYLQLLAPVDARMGDKQAVDFNVTALRILARDLKTPVWCVATLNRESYSGPVDMDSFKESGAIEYGCDYAFGLQPQGIAAEVADAKSAVEKKLRGNAYIAKAKRDNPRKVELTVLKNRQGETTGNDRGIQLAYYPRTNLFI